MASVPLDVGSKEYAAVVGTTEGKMYCVDLEGRRVAGDRQLSTWAVVFVGFDPRTGELWTVCEDGVVQMFSTYQDVLLLQKSPVRRCSLQSLQPRCAVVLPGGRLVVGSKGYLDVYTTASAGAGEIINVLHSPVEGGVSAVCQGAGSLDELAGFWTGHPDGSLRLWRPDKQADPVTLLIVRPGVEIRTMVMVRGYLWLGCSDGYLRIVGSATGVMREWKAHNSAVTHLALSGDTSSPDRFMASSSKAGTVRLWDAYFRENWVLQRMWAHEDHYSVRKEHLVKICSWNLNAKSPSEDLSPLLDAHPAPDILVMGFQEIVPLSATSVLSSDPAVVRAWEREIEGTLTRLQLDKAKRGAKEGADFAFTRVLSKQLVGIALIVYCNNKHLRNLQDVQFNITKTGFKGMAGNKGGISISFRFFDSLYCFTNCHLAAGQNAWEARNNDKRTIAGSTTFPERDPTDGGASLYDHDAVFFFGDLNYRLDMSYAEVHAAIETKSWPLLAAADQLNIQKGTSDVWDDFQEPRLNFCPTYKYDTGTDTWDTSAKKRAPAWCDRILYRGAGIECIEYNRAELKTSDHKPVYGLFTSKTKIVSPEAREAVAAEIEVLWKERWRELIAEEEKAAVGGVFPETVFPLMPPGATSPASAAAAALSPTSSAVASSPSNRSALAADDDSDAASSGPASLPAAQGNRRGSIAVQQARPHSLPPKVASGPAPGASPAAAPVRATASSAAVDDLLTFDSPMIPAAKQHDIEEQHRHQLEEDKHDLEILFGAPASAAPAAEATLATAPPAQPAPSPSTTAQPGPSRPSPSPTPHKPLPPTPPSKKPAQEGNLIDF